MTIIHRRTLLAGAASAFASPLDRSYLARFLRAFYRRRLTARGRA